MSIAVTIGGLQYNVPEVGESNWGQNVSDILVAISANIAGGGFFTVVPVASSPITVVSGRTYLVDTSAARQLDLPAPTINAYCLVRDSTGTAATFNITLHRNGGEKIDGSAADKVLAIDSGQWWLFSDGTDWFTLINSGAIMNKDIAATAAIAYSKLNLATSIVNADVAAGAAIAYSKLNLATSILNADISVGAAIDRAKVAAGTADHVLINSGTGALSSEAKLAVVRGGTNSSTALNNNRVMQSNGGAIVEAAAITAARALISDANGIPTHSAVTSAELAHVSGVTSAIQTQLTALQLYRRNAIINGAMDVWQRGTSFADIASGAFSADRFKYSRDGATTARHTVSRDTDVPASFPVNYSLKADCTTADASIAAGEYCGFLYSVEGHDFRRFVGKTATFSFWVKATKIGTYCVSFRSSNGDRSYVAEYTVNVTDTWEFKTVTLTFNYAGGTWDYTNGAGLQIGFMLAAGTDWHTTANAWQTGSFLATANQVNACDNVANNFWITGVQLEEGSAATAFDWIPFAETLRLCQRYYCISGGYGVASNYDCIMFGLSASSCVGSILFPVEMRAVPVVKFYNGATINQVRRTSDAVAISATEVIAALLTARGFNAIGSGVGMAVGVPYDFRYVAEIEL